MNIRKGKEYYARYYDEALRLYSEGLSAADIAAKLNISYSAVYHWVKGLRKPAAGNVTAFIGHIQKNGPSAVIDIKQTFPKHNEIFLTAVRRGLPVKRYMMKKKFHDYSTWYYVEGQEKQLEISIKSLLDKVKEVKEKLFEVK